MIVFRLQEQQFVLVGRAPTVNWVQFHAETGDFDMQVERDDRSPARPSGKPVIRKRYRFQIQGPNAPQILEKLNGGPIPEIKFFNMGTINIAGREVLALRHDMAGAPGLEVWEPNEEEDEIRAAMVEAGKEFGLYQVGSRAYSTNTLESGWIPSPLPAIYTGEKMKPYRERRDENSYEATGPIGGSYVSDNIEDYYVTPYELGYGIYVKFDHDFIGREALEKIANQPHRRKVTFEWNAEDVAKVIASCFVPSGENYKWIDLPQANYTSSSFDKIMMGDKLVGLSMFNGFCFNERAMLSLGIVDPDVKLGDVLTLV